MITVYVPTFNRAAKLREALTSLRLQTLGKDLFRVVVADNASTDETSRIIGEFSDLALVYRRREQNVGLVANWSGAREFFDSEYFQFLSDDDLLAPHHLEFCWRQLDSRPAVGVFGTGVLYGAGVWEPNTSRGDLRLGDRWLDPADFCFHWSQEAWLAAHSIYSAVNVNACLFRTPTLLGIEPLFDASVAAITDRWMMAQVGARTTCVTSPWPSCALRVHGDNAIHGAGLTDIEDLSLEVARRVLGLAGSLGLDLPGYWRRFFRESGARGDIAALIRHAYPADLAGAILDVGDMPRRQLDRWPLPQAWKDAIRSWRSRWRRGRGAWLS